MWKLQVAEKKELGASILHKSEVKNHTSAHSITPKGIIYSIHTAWSRF